MNNSTTYGPDGKTLLEEILDNGDNTAIKKTYQDGVLQTTETIAWDSSDHWVDPQAEAINKALAAVAGMSASSNTRKAIEALAEALQVGNQ